MAGFVKEALAVNGPTKKAGLRESLPFRLVNCTWRPGHQPDMQKHHILPCELKTTAAFSRLIELLTGRFSIFDDFRLNGMLLPSTESGALRWRLPIHRGPHRRYNQIVCERFAQIEDYWSKRSLSRPDIALGEAVMRIRLLQSALKRRLLQRFPKPMVLNQRDPFDSRLDFGNMDKMAETLWTSTSAISNSPRTSLAQPANLDRPIADLNRLSQGLQPRGLPRSK